MTILDLYIFLKQLLTTQMQTLLEIAYIQQLTHIQQEDIL